ncbi:MAG: tetratricopeptide repeat protein [Verrucomicrobiia bacterium]|jgi:tetratricopeptide (TPR) repeat protein
MIAARKLSGWGSAVIVLLTVAAYFPALHGGFVWDDDDHLTANLAMTAPHGLRMIWSSLSVSRYYPLTLTSFWLQRRLWGLNPMPYHMVNIGLHAINGVLLFLVLQRLRVRAAWLAAAMWALHPVNVESVAWVTELKNTQSGFFFFIAVLCFLRFETDGRHRWYGLALLSGTAALLSKPSTVVLPLVLLLCHSWQRGRWRWKDILRTVPFFAMALLMSVLTIVEQRGHILNQASAEWSLGIAERFLVASRAIWFYAKKALWPVDLAFVYPRWDIRIASILAWLPLAGLGAVGLVLWVWRSRPWGHAALFGLGYFACALLPVLGFFDVYYFRYSFVADHFQYLASAGIVTMVAGGIVNILGRQSLWPSPLKTAVSLAPLAALTVLTWQQTQMYVNGETLFRRTIQLNPRCWMAYNNLGVLVSSNRIEDAMEMYHQSLAINPSNAEAHVNIGNALLQLGQLAGAREQYQEAAHLRPGFAEAHHNLGVVLSRLGQRQEAREQWEQAVRIDPNYADAHVNLGTTLAQMGDTEGAIRHLTLALQIKPDNVEALDDLGNVMMGLGRVQQAIRYYEQALRLKPDSVQAHNNMGIALTRLGQVEKAITHWKQAVQIDPHYADAHYNLGVALERTGNVGDAIEQYEQTLRIKPDYAEAQKKLARLQSAQ